VFSPKTELRQLEPQEARAQELLLLASWDGASCAGTTSYRKKAERVLQCNVAIEEHPWTCKLRECPACNSRKAEKLRYEFVKAINSMKHPVLVLITLWSLNLDDLGQTIKVFRRLFLRFRRTSLRSVPTATGMIEPKLAKNRRFWALHAHIVLDAAALRWCDLREDWSRLTGNRGRFGEDDRRVDRRPFSLAAYVVSGKDSCPAPGTMAPANLDRLWRALYRVQLPINWGPRIKRGRHARAVTK